MKNNSIQIFNPYWSAGMWVFDDEARERKQEPFTSGISDMIKVLIKDIPDATEGFRFLLSNMPFPEFILKLNWVMERDGGNWYRYEKITGEVWLCAALLGSYEKPPKELYIKAEPIQD